MKMNVYISYSYCHEQRLATIGAADKQTRTTDFHINLSRVYSKRIALLLQALSLLRYQTQFLSGHVTLSHLVPLQRAQANVTRTPIASTQPSTPTLTRHNLP